MFTTSFISLFFVFVLMAFTVVLFATPENQLSSVGEGEEDTHTSDSALQGNCFCYQSMTLIINVYVHTLVEIFLYNSDKIMSHFHSPAVML